MAFLPKIADLFPAPYLPTGYYSQSRDKSLALRVLCNKLQQKPKVVMHSGKCLENNSYGDDMIERMCRCHFFFWEKNKEKAVVGLRYLLHHSFSMQFKENKSAVNILFRLIILVDGDDESYQ